MRKRWLKLGQLYVPRSVGQHPKLISHAANPLPIHLTGDVYRVFFSARDRVNRSSVGAVDIDIVKRQVVKEFNEPFFEHGPDGSFYADGVSIGNCYPANGINYMLFMGWQTRPNTHWRGDIGRIIVNPDLTLQLDSITPLMTSDVNDPISLSYPWVIKNSDSTYSMWYGSTSAWDAGNGEMLHVIKNASSYDGHVWVRHNSSVPYEINIAQAFSRPTVVCNPDGPLEMWFSYRGGEVKHIELVMLSP